MGRVIARGQEEGAGARAANLPGVLGVVSATGNRYYSLDESVIAMMLYWRE
jgi:hypothetical protein